MVKILRAKLMASETDEEDEMVKLSEVSMLAIATQIIVRTHMRALLFLWPTVCVCLFVPWIAATPPAVAWWKLGGGVGQGGPVSSPIGDETGLAIGRANYVHIWAMACYFAIPSEPAWLKAGGL